MEDIFIHIFAEKLELLGYSKRIIADYPAYVRLFFRYCEENENLTSILDIKPEHITAYHTWLQYKRRENGGYLSTATVRARLQCVKAFYSILFREAVLDRDYAPLMVLPRSKRSLPKHVPSEKEMKQLIDSVEPLDPLTTRDRALLETMYATALRSEEVRTLTVDSFDITEKTFLVKGKGGRDRIVPVGDWVIPYLMEYLTASRPRLINSREPSDLLFVSKNGRRIINCNLNTLIGKYAKKAGLESRITPHSFRHACATHLLKAGADIRYVQELLGHAQLSTTQIYTKIDITTLKAAHKKYHPRERIDDAK
jgi:integrase/recombinase XerD